MPGTIPAENTATTDCSAMAAYRIMAMAGGIMLSIRPEAVSRPAAKRVS
jgi:hypothetical protein